MKKTKFIAAALAVLFVFNTYALPRSKAVVIDATAAFGAAAVTAAVNGTTATTLFTGMGTSAATSSVVGLMDTYAVTTGVAASGTALASTIATGILVAGGTLLVGAAAAALIGGFIDWLREEKGLEAGGNSALIYEDSGYFVSDFKIFRWGSSIQSIGDVFPFGTTLSVNGHTVSALKISDNTIGYFLDGSKIHQSVESRPFNDVFGIGYDTKYGDGCFVTSNSDGTFSHISMTLLDVLGLDSVPYQDLSVEVEPHPEFQEIPNDIPEGQILSIDTGLSALPQADPQAAADAIMQSAIDGVLNPIVSVENDPTVTPDPDPDPDPDPTPPPEDLPQNLPQLGDVLISRFPFSIPWDVGRVLDFLSAEPVAPHIEFQPFKGDLFGIPADSVSVDYDFSKHEDIAAFCRTFEIVGFCLLLAVGTKRLIWTA